jgi:hypothetical protein
MKRLTLRCTITALVLSVAAAMIPTASADQVTWNLVNVTFSDRGTASGSFVFDANTNTVSSVNITTTAGTSFVGATYTGEDPGFLPDATAMDVVTNPLLSDLTGTPDLFMSFQSALTDLGGTIALLTNGGESMCINPGCTLAGPKLRALATGEVVSSVPEPSSILLLGMGMFALAGAARRKLLRA